MNKYLEKMARMRSLPEFAQTLGTRVNRALKKPVVRGRIIGSAVGAVSGGGLAYSRDKGLVYEKGRPKYKTFTTKEKIKRGIAGAISGGISGFMVGDAVGGIKGLKLQQKYYQRSPGILQRAASRRSTTTRATSRTIHDIHADLGAPTSGFKTKTEAKTHFRRAVMKHHPDREGGSVEKMQRINKAWDEYQAHPEGFNKLAMLIQATKDWLTGIK